MLRVYITPTEVVGVLLCWNRASSVLLNTHTQTHTRTRQKKKSSHVALHVLKLFKGPILDYLQNFSSWVPVVKQRLMFGSQHETNQTTRLQKTAYLAFCKSTGLKCTGSCYSRGLVGLSPCLKWGNRCPLCCHKEMVPRMPCLFCGGSKGRKTCFFLSLLLEFLSRRVKSVEIFCTWTVLPSE